MTEVDCQRLCTLVFVELARASRKRRTLTYTELGAAVRLGPSDPKLHAALERIWLWCAQTQMMHINALVVRSAPPRQGLPGSGYRPGGRLVSRDEWERLRDRIFVQDWHAAHRYYYPIIWPPGLRGASSSTGSAEADGETGRAGPFVDMAFDALAEFFADFGGLG